MKLLQYDTCRYRRTNIKIVNDSIIAIHSDEITGIEEISSEEQLTHCSSKNEYVSALLMNDGYCPEYLSGIIKSIKAQCKKNLNVKAIYKSLDDRMRSDWRQYISLYKEEELVDIILKFGKDIWEIFRKYRYEIILPLVQHNLKESYKTFKMAIRNIDRESVSLSINDLIKKIGISTLLHKNGKYIWSKWDLFVYISMLLYLVKALAYNIETLDDIKSDNKTDTVNSLIEYILTYINKVNKKNNYKVEYYILKTKSDSKEVYKITSALHFVYDYVVKHYGVNLEGYDMILQDMVELQLDAFRDDLINKEKNKTKINKIKKYSYKKLKELYNRKLFNY